MRKVTILFIMVVALFSLNGCVTMQIVSISDVKPSIGTKVNASADGMGFLHLGVPMNLAEKVTDELKSKGAVGNVSTVMTMREWGIVQYYQVNAIGITEVPIKAESDLKPKVKVEKVIENKVNLDPTVATITFIYPRDSQLFIDEQLVGKTPYKATLTRGVHKVFMNMKRSGKVLSTTIDFSEKNDNTNIVLNFNR